MGGFGPNLCRSLLCIPHVSLVDIIYWIGWMQLLVEVFESCIMDGIDGIVLDWRIFANKGKIK